MLPTQHPPPTTRLSPPPTPPHHRRLILGAYEGAPLPDYLTSPDFYKFSPAEDFLALPGDIARTNFRLVVTLGGWEYGVADRELGVNPDPQRNLLVTVGARPGLAKRAVCVLGGGRGGGGEWEWVRGWCGHGGGWVGSFWHVCGMAGVGWGATLCMHAQLCLLMMPLAPRRMAYSCTRPLPACLHLLRVPAPGPSPHSRQVAEFESDVFELDGQECVMNLISYPTICVRRDFLDAAVRWGGGPGGLQGVCPVATRGPVCCGCCCEAWMGLPCCGWACGGLEGALGWLLPLVRLHAASSGMSTRRLPVRQAGPLSGAAAARAAAMCCPAGLARN